MDDKVTVFGRLISFIEISDRAFLAPVKPFILISVYILSIFFKQCLLFNY